MNTAADTLTALDVIYSRRSVRAYTREQVPQSTARALIDAAVQAPSAFGAQSSSFVVVQNPRRLARLSELTKSLWIQQAEKDPFLHLAAASGPEGDLLARYADPAFDVFYAPRRSS